MARINPVTQPEPTGGSLERRTMLQEIVHRFKKNKLAMVGVCILIAMYAMAIFAPWIIPYSQATDVNTDLRFLPPSGENWLGTDDLGRDVWARVVWGSRISLSVGFVAAFFSVTIGTVVGSIAGYYGGVIDNLLMRLTEIVLAFPVFFLLLTIISVLPKSIFNIMLIIGLTSWPGLARIVRGQFLALREMDFTQAANAAGARDPRIIFRHILPNSMAPIIVSATLRIGNAILAETSLSFLGLGAPPPFPSWGVILANGRAFLRNAPWIATFPGAFIFLTVLAFNFIGDGLRDALDPKLKL